MNKRPATFTYDPDEGNNLYYVYLASEKTKVAKTIEVGKTLLDNGVNLDLDDEGNLIGIELLFGPPLKEYTI